MSQGSSPSREVITIYEAKKLPSFVYKKEELVNKKCLTNFLVENEIEFEEENEFSQNMLAVVKITNIRSPQHNKSARRSRSPPPEAYLTRSRQKQRKFLADYSVEIKEPIQKKTPPKKRELTPTNYYFGAYTRSLSNRSRDSAHSQSPSRNTIKKKLLSGDIKQKENKIDVSPRPAKGTTSKKPGKKRKKTKNSSKDNSKGSQSPIDRTNRSNNMSRSYSGNELTTNDSAQRTETPNRSISRTFNDLKLTEIEENLAEKYKSSKGDGQMSFKNSPTNADTTGKGYDNNSIGSSKQKKKDSTYESFAKNLSQLLFNTDKKLKGLGKKDKKKKKQSPVDKLVRQNEKLLDGDSEEYGGSGEIGSEERKEYLSKENTNGGIASLEEIMKDKMKQKFETGGGQRLRSEEDQAKEKRGLAYMSYDELRELGYGLDQKRFSWESNREPPVFAENTGKFIVFGDQGQLQRLDSLDSRNSANNLGPEFDSLTIRNIVNKAYEDLFDSRGEFRSGKDDLHSFGHNSLQSKARSQQGELPVHTRSRDNSPYQSLKSTEREKLIHQGADSFAQKNPYEQYGDNLGSKKGSRRGTDDQDFREFLDSKAREELGKDEYAFDNSNDLLMKQLKEAASNKENKDADTLDAGDNKYTSFEKEKLSEFSEPVDRTGSKPNSHGPDSRSNVPQNDYMSFQNQENRYFEEGDVIEEKSKDKTHGTNQSQDNRPASLDRDDFEERNIEDPAEWARQQIERLKRNSQDREGFGSGKSRDEMSRGDTSKEIDPAEWARQQIEKMRSNDQENKIPGEEQSSKHETAPRHDSRQSEKTPAKSAEDLAREQLEKIKQAEEERASEKRKGSTTADPHSYTDISGGEVSEPQLNADRHLKAPKGEDTETTEQSTRRQNQQIKPPQEDLQDDLEKRLAENLQAVASELQSQKSKKDDQGQSVHSQGKPKSKSEISEEKESPREDSPDRTSEKFSSNQTKKSTDKNREHSPSKFGDNAYGKNSDKILGKKIRKTGSPDRDSQNSGSRAGDESVVDSNRSLRRMLLDPLGRRSKQSLGKKSEKSLGEKRETPSPPKKNIDPLVMSLLNKRSDSPVSQISGGGSSPARNSGEDRSSPERSNSSNYRRRNREKKNKPKYLGGFDQPSDKADVIGTLKSSIKEQHITPEDLQELSGISYNHKKKPEPKKDKKSSKNQRKEPKRSALNLKKLREAERVFQDRYKERGGDFQSNFNSKASKYSASSRRESVMSNLSDNANLSGMKTQDRNYEKPWKLQNQPDHKNNRAHPNRRGDDQEYEFEERAQKRSRTPNRSRSPENQLHSPNAKQDRQNHKTPSRPGNKAMKNSYPHETYDRDSAFKSPNKQQKDRRRHSPSGELEKTLTVPDLRAKKGPYDNQPKQHFTTVSSPDKSSPYKGQDKRFLLKRDQLYTPSNRIRTDVKDYMPSSKKPAYTTSPKSKHPTQAVDDSFAPDRDSPDDKQLNREGRLRAQRTEGDHEDDYRHDADYEDEPSAREQEHDMDESAKQKRKKRLIKPNPSSSPPRSKSPYHKRLDDDYLMKEYQRICLNLFDCDFNIHDRLVLEEYYQRSLEILLHQCQNFSTVDFSAYLRFLVRTAKRNYIQHMKNYFNKLKEDAYMRAYYQNEDALEDVVEESDAQ